jgi:predicted oxidoreductase
MKLTTQRLKKIIKEELGNIVAEYADTGAEEVTAEEEAAIGKIENALKRMGTNPLDISLVHRPKNSQGAVEKHTIVKVQGRILAFAFPDGRAVANNFPRLKNELTKEQ